MVAALSVTERRMHSHWGDSGKRECSSRMHLTLPLSGRQEHRGGVAVSWWWPVYSRGLLSVLLRRDTSLECFLGK